MPKKILLLGELYRPLIPWFLYDKPPKGVPAVYNLYQYLGNSADFQFHSVIYNPEIETIKKFPNGSTIELKKFNFPIYYVWKFLVLFKLFFWGGRQLKKQQYDLVYGLSTFSLVAAFLGKKYKIPSVGRIYGTILTKDVNEGNYFRLYTRFLFDVLSIKYPADKVICTLDGTEYDKVFHFFNKNPDQQPQLLYNGMESGLRSKLLSFPNVQAFQSPAKFCYIARLEPYKRQEIAIEVVNHLVHNYGWDEIQLTIIGSGSMEKKLKDLVSAKGLEKQVVFISEMPHQDIPDFIRDQDAAFFFYEGGSLGNVLWESALAGKLIVTVDNAGTGVLFKDGQNCIIAPDSENLAKEIVEKLEARKEESLLDLTSQSRELVKSLILTWEERFDKEFKEIHFK